MKRIIRSLCCLSAAFGGFLGLSSVSAAEMAARYRPVEWVELRGGAVFDTGRMTEATDEIRFKFAMMAKATNYDSAFGDYEGETITATRVIYYNKTTATDFYVNFMSQANSCTRVAGVVTTFGEPVEGYLNASHVKLNAKEANLTQTAATPTTKTMALTSTAKVPVRYWYFRIVNKETGATILDWTPCRDVDTGACGFWDGVKFIEGVTGDAGEIVGGPVLISVSNPAPQVFTGEEIKPAVTVTSVDVSGESHVLTEGTDYQITYAHNVGLGTANVTVVGKAGGVFEGSIATTTFEITAPEPGDVALGGTFAYLRRQMLKDGATFSTAGITVVDAQGKALDPSTYTIHTANTEGTDVATVWATVTSGSYAGQMAIGKVAVVYIEDGFEPTPTDFPYVDGSAYEMPEGYVRLGYIEGSGVSAAIGTGLKPHYTRSAAEAIVEFPDPSADSPIWCAWKSEGVREISAEYVAGMGFRFRKSSTSSTSVVCEPFDIPCEVRADARYRVTMNMYEENGVRRHYAQVECNDEFVGRVQMEDGSDNYSTEVALSIFVRGSSYATCRILSFRLWDYYNSPNFKADYVPALQLSDGAVGFYDFVGKTFKPVSKYFGAPLGKTREWGPVSELTLAVDPVVYGGRSDGTAQEPPVVVRDKVTGAVLTANDDYTLAYFNNVNAGMASVVVTGKGAYEGQVACERFVIPKVFHVTADGTTEGSGETWSSAMTFDAAMAAVVGSADPSEVWIAGTVAPAAATSYTTASSFAIRGGFVGTETSVFDRAAGARSTVSGNDTLTTCLTLTHATSNPYDAVTIDSVEFTRTTQRTVWAKGYNFTFQNCAFTHCGHFNWAVDSDLADHKGENDGGGALRVEVPAGNSTWSGWKLIANSYLVMKDCEISDCVSSSSAKAGNGALYVFRVNDVTIENCKFLDNKTSAGFGSTYGHAVALALTSSRGVVRGCEFRGNVSTTKCPQIVNINLFSGDWTFDRCVFAGNTLGSDATYSYGGLIEVQAEPDPAATVDIRNCTFAYNTVADGAAVNAYYGTIRVKNSIFWKNVATLPAQHGCDLITTSADGSCSASYCLFTEKGENGAAYYSRYNGLGTLDVMEKTIQAANPRFVTDAWDPEKDEATDIDLHLLSGAGYRKNGDETWYLSEGVQSPAIDKGDPDDSVGDEPAPNGGVINLGVYGGTASASKTAEAHPAIAGEITVTWPSAWSQPVVHFTTGGEGAYSASVAIQISTDGGATWAYAPDPLTGIANGETVDHLVTTCFPPEGKLTVKVTISAAGSDASKQADNIDVEGTLPPCWGKGGGDGIVHVRPGATGKGDGTSWWDAVTTLEEGLALLAPERPELWWAARTNELVDGSAAYQFAIPVKIRGGFAGTESAASQRLPGARSVIDGHGEVGPCFQFSNTASVTLDSIEFVRSSKRGLYRAASTGDLLITNCAFRCCGLGEFTGAGSGFNVAGVAGNRVSGVRVVDSQIEGNVAYRVNDLNGPSGVGMRADNLRVLELVNCTVRTNVYMSTRSGGTYALHAENTPVTIEGCAFRGNRGASNTTAPSVIRLSGTSGGSVIRNSVFAGNYLNTGGSRAGVVEVFATSSADDVYEIDNCTFAYNYVDYGAAVTVPACVLKVKNSIFHANAGGPGKGSVGGVDIASSSATAALEVSYSMFDGEGTNYVSAVTEDPVAVTNCVYGDPKFVTTTEMFAELASVDLSKLPRAANNYTHPSDAVACSYDLHETRKSPAVDAGDPASDYRREPKPNGRCVNLGCYGNTREAALSKQGGVLIVR